MGCVDRRRSSSSLVHELRVTAVSGNAMTASVLVQKSGSTVTKRQDWVVRGSRLPGAAVEWQDGPADLLAARPRPRRRYPVQAAHCATRYRHRFRSESGLRALERCLWRRCGPRESGPNPFLSQSSPLGALSRRGWPDGTSTFPTVSLCRTDPTDRLGAMVAGKRCSAVQEWANG